MAQTHKSTPISPEDCLHQLPELALEPFKATDNDILRRSELRHALRGITQMNHVTETALVLGLVEKILGRVPELTE